MWGRINQNNSQNPYANPYGAPQNKPAGNRSKIPMTPGVALLGLVGQNTIKQQQQQWENGNNNYNYPTFSPQSNASNASNPYLNTNSQSTPPNQNNYGYSPYNISANLNLSPPPLQYTPNNQQQQWNNYQLRNYMLNKMILDQYIPTIFQRWDLDRSGTIEMHEFPGMICELFRCMNLPPPSQNDMWYLMWKFDQDQNGKIDYYEWANMVYTLGGLK